ncbi:MAG TPA: BamA/TamA family outer membrane protein [Steroidobacteraceae bacterium]|nr:BamA/TamA family outer membrane protein [Steroidobacteraceae bacterium]
MLPHEAAWTQVAADAPGALSTPAPATPPPPSSDWLARWTDPSSAPFIPIPEIDTDPQTGTTLGLIAVVLRVNARGEIARILAPDLFKSQYFGWGARMRIYDYPSEDTQWSVVGGAKQRVEREFDALYTTGLTRREPLSWSVETVYDRSGTARFFGIGNESLFANETTYVNNQGDVSAMIGRNFTPALQLAYVARLRVVDVLPGVLPGIPSIETVYPGLKGIGSEHALENTVMLTFDTRDSTVMPQSGARYVVYGGLANSALASSVSYSYVGAEARYYWPLTHDTTFAWHAAVRYMPSAADAPFWALSSLGGDRSVTGEREPLRSNGDDRYLDRDLFATGVELRARVAGFDAFGTRVSLEVAPFVDTGKVFGSAGTSPVSQLHAAAGFGVRGVASPYVVGYVDFGFSHGRSAVFSGINYPF